MILKEKNQKGKNQKENKGKKEKRKKRKEMFQTKESMSYLNKGQWTTDNNEMKHMSKIPFPVCADTAIQYKRWRWIMKENDKNKMKQNKIK